MLGCLIWTRYAVMVVKCGCMLSVTKFPATYLRSIPHVYLTLFCSVWIGRPQKEDLTDYSLYLCFVESGGHWLLLPNLQSEVWFWIIRFWKNGVKSQVSLPFPPFSLISSIKSILPFFMFVFSNSSMVPMNRSSYFLCSNLILNCSLHLCMSCYCEILVTDGTNMMVNWCYLTRLMCSVMVWKAYIFQVFTCKCK